MHDTSGVNMKAKHGAIGEVCTPWLLSIARATSRLQDDALSALDDEPISHKRQASASYQRDGCPAHVFLSSLSPRPRKPWVQNCAVSMYRAFPRPMLKRSPVVACASTRATVLGFSPTSFPRDLKPFVSLTARMATYNSAPAEDRTAAFCVADQ